MINLIASDLLTDKVRRVVMIRAAGIARGAPRILKISAI